jgi:hypothetical protein
MGKRSLPPLGVGAVSCFERPGRWADLKLPSDERAFCSSPRRPRAPPPTTCAAREGTLYEAAVNCKVLLVRQCATRLGFHAERIEIDEQATRPYPAAPAVQDDASFIYQLCSASVWIALYEPPSMRGSCDHDSRVPGLPERRRSWSFSTLLRRRMHDHLTAVASCSAAVRLCWRFTTTDKPAPGLMLRDRLRDPIPRQRVP